MTLFKKLDCLFKQKFLNSNHLLNSKEANQLLFLPIHNRYLENDVKKNLTSVKKHGQILHQIITFKFLKKVNLFLKQ